MTAIQDMTIPIAPGQCYHIFNRGINRQAIFFIEDNYRHFMAKYKKYMFSYWDTYAWVLMPNHFHLVIKVNSVNKLIEVSNKDFIKVSQGFLTKHERLITELLELQSTENACNPDLTSFKDLLNLSSASKNNPIGQQLLLALLTWSISERFRRFLLGYAKAINKQQKRTGSLFQKPFRRKEISSDKALINTICYVHHNPIHHNFMNSYEHFHWSSYNSYFNGDKVSNSLNGAINVFGGLDKMKAQHKVYRTQYKVKVDQANLELES